MEKEIMMVPQFFNIGSVEVCVGENNVEIKVIYCKFGMTKMISL